MQGVTPTCAELAQILSWTIWCPAASSQQAPRCFPKTLCKQADMLRLPHTHTLIYPVCPVWEGSCFFFKRDPRKLKCPWSVNCKINIRSTFEHSGGCFYTEGGEKESGLAGSWCWSINITLYNCMPHFIEVPSSCQLLIIQVWCMAQLWI